MIKSKALLFSDFETAWYKHWAKLLKQTEAHRGNFELQANKFWQNAIMAQVLDERGVLSQGARGLGFGVGKERLPALFAKMGVAVTATDQDFKTGKASTWDNDQLAHGSQSLNTEGICPEARFKANVDYRAVDMKQIPKDLFNAYDFLWSNCALGHLGSIADSRHFIKESLQCLKPGGWAVHTTEANILSNDQTLDSTDTVFFRQKDLYELFADLSRQGYRVNVLHFDLGSTARDQAFTLFPKWGSDFSKILYDGYMATQILLIIQKPSKPTPNWLRQAEVVKHRTQYLKNLLGMRQFLARNRALSTLLAHDRQARIVLADQLAVSSKDTALMVEIGCGKTVEVALRYHNGSNAGLFKLHGTLHNTKPIVLATYNPINRSSLLSDTSWYETNRPTITMTTDNTKAEPEYIEPGLDFAVTFQISTKKLRPGKYEEWFCLVREGDGPIPQSKVKVNIRVK